MQSRVKETPKWMSRNAASCVQHGFQQVRRHANQFVQRLTSCLNLITLSLATPTGDVRQSLLAESVVLRGARTQPPAPPIPPSPAAAAQSAPVGMPAAAAALDASLLSEGQLLPAHATYMLRHDTLCFQPWLIHCIGALH